MILLKQNNPQCMLYSAAMLLDTTPEQLIQEIGHDGLEIIWPDTPRGFHIQEIIDCCIRRGKALVPIDRNLISAPTPDVTPMVEYNDERFFGYLELYKGLLIIRVNDKRHMCAWDCAYVYDPRGYVRTLNHYNVIGAWILL